MKALTELTAGIFHEISGQYVLPTENIPDNSVIEVGPKLPLTCMFTIHFALVAGVRVGFIFTSQFEVQNAGAYLMTYLRNKGPATEHETLIKDESLVIYHYPNKGTLAISPKVNSEIQSIFEEQ